MPGDPRGWGQKSSVSSGIQNKHHSSSDPWRKRRPLLSNFAKIIQWQLHREQVDDGSLQRDQEDPAEGSQQPPNPSDRLLPREGSYSSLHNLDFYPSCWLKRVFCPLDFGDVGLRVLAKNRPNCATDDVNFCTIGSLGLVSRVANVTRAIKGSYHLGP